MDAAGRLNLIRDLCAFEGRGPATDAERRAGDYLLGRLRGVGRRAEIEPTLVRPSYALIHAIHAAVALTGSLLAQVQPAVGFGLVLVAATATYFDLNTRAYLVRRLFYRRVSQNVVSPGRSPGAPGRLLLVAHYDAAKTGLVFSRAASLGRRLSPRARLLLGPFRILFWGGIAPLLPILGLQMAGFDPGWLNVIQVIPTAILVIAIFLLIDIALSDVVPGAYDNASGVAAVLSAAEELDAEPPANLDVWVVLTGAEECLAEGMRAFVRSHKADLDPERTWVVNVDSVSHGDVSYQVSEGAVVSVPLDAGLVDLARSLANADLAGENRFAAAPLRFPRLDDAMAAKVRGIPAITIRTTEAGAQAPWYHTKEDVPELVSADDLTRATEFVVGLARLLDREVGRKQPAPAVSAPPLQSPKDPAPTQGPPPATPGGEAEEVPVDVKEAAD